MARQREIELMGDYITCQCDVKVPQNELDDHLLSQLHKDNMSKKGLNEQAVLARKSAMRKEMKEGEEKLEGVLALKKNLEEELQVKVEGYEGRLLALNHEIRDLKKKVDVDGQIHIN